MENHEPGSIEHPTPLNQHNHPILSLVNTINAGFSSHCSEFMVHLHGPPDPRPPSPRLRPPLQLHSSSSARGWVDLRRRKSVAFVGSGHECGGVLEWGDPLDHSFEDGFSMIKPSHFGKPPYIYQYRTTGDSIKIVK